MKFKELSYKEQLLSSLLTADNDKLNYAIKRNLKLISDAKTPLIEAHNEAIADLNNKHGDVDEKGHLLLNEKGEHTFKKEDQIKHVAEGRELLKKLLDTEIPINNPTFVEDSWPRVSDIDDFTKEELQGVLFKPSDLSKKAACEKAHQGQAGECDDQGNWHPEI